MDSHSAHSAARARKKRLYTVTAIIVVVLFLAVVGIAQLTRGAKPQAAAPKSTAAPSASPSSTPDDLVDWVRRDPSDPLAIGEVSAPVVITEWTDPRCPFCAHFHTDILPKLKEKYVDTGKVRFEFRIVAYFGQQSETAAVAMAAAGAQGKFTAYADALFKAAPAKGHPDLPKPKLIDFARTAGVPDIQKFTADLDSSSLAEQVRQHTREAQEVYGIQAVPFFAASDGETALRGTQPLPNFIEFIDGQLKKADSR